MHLVCGPCLHPIKSSVENSANGQERNPRQQIQVDVKSKLTSLDIYKFMADVKAETI